MADMSKSAPDDDDGSYEEIVVSDEEEYLEYYDEILDEDSEGDFTEVTIEGEDGEQILALDNFAEKNAEMGNQSTSNLEVSISNLSIEASNHKPRRQSTIKRPLIKTSTEKALEAEQARIAKEENAIKFKLARNNSFIRKDNEALVRLQEEEEQHIREEEEGEQLRIDEENRLAKLRADEASVQIMAQKQDEERERLEELENQRLVKEAEERKLEQEKAAKEKAVTDKARKEKEEADRLAREKAKREMEEEVRQLEAQLAEKKRLAAEADAKRVAEQARLQAKVQERRQAKKEQESQLPSSQDTQATKASPATAEAVPSTEAVDNGNITYYSVEDLRKMKIPGLDYKNREIYLSPSDFKSIFAMTIEEFEEQPKWKKTTLKRKAKLF